MENATFMIELFQATEKKQKFGTMSSTDLTYLSSVAVYPKIYTHSFWFVVVRYGLILYTAFRATSLASLLLITAKQI